MCCLHRHKGQYTFAVPCAKVQHMLVNKKQRTDDLNLKAVILIYFNVLMKASFILDNVFSCKENNVFIAASDVQIILN